MSHDTRQDFAPLNQLVEVGRNCLQRYAYYLKSKIAIDQNKPSIFFLEHKMNEIKWVHNSRILIQSSTFSVGHLFIESKTHQTKLKMKLDKTQSNRTNEWVTLSWYFTMH